MTSRKRIGLGIAAALAAFGAIGGKIGVDRLLAARAAHQEFVDRVQHVDDAARWCEGADGDAAGRLARLRACRAELDAEIERAGHEGILVGSAVAAAHASVASRFASSIPTAAMRD